MWPVWNVAGLGRGRSVMWQIWDVAGLGRGRSVIWQVCDVAGMGRGRSGTWPVWDSSVSFAICQERVFWPNQMTRPKLRSCTDWSG